MTTKNIDFETLLKKTDSRIRVTAPHSGDAELFRFVVKSCRLRPGSSFVGKKLAPRAPETYWLDEFGNSLRIADKSMTIVTGDINLDERAKISSDLFFGRSMDVTASESKNALVFGGEYFGRACNFVAFYGTDEYLRSFLYFDIWSRVSPLLLGLGTIKELHTNIKSIMQANRKIDENKLDSLIKLDVLYCTVCEPSEWKKHTGEQVIDGKR